MVDTGSLNSEQNSYVRGNYNYMSLLSLYMKQCEEFFSKPLTITGPWTREARKHVIRFIKHNRIVFLDFAYNLDSSVLKMYQIVIDPSENLEKLVLTDTATEVLPYEECFDIFYEVHKLTHHGRFADILAKLDKKYRVHFKCLEIFLSNCDVCKQSRKDRIPLVFNDTIDIDFLKSPVNNEDCKYILFYIDRATGFVLIRPLLSMNEYELSMELLKIFTDYGPPYVIESKDSAIINNVLGILAKGGLKYDICINTSNELLPGVSYHLIEEIMKRSEARSGNWSSICRYIQYTYNNSLQAIGCSRKNVLERCIPHQKLFNTKIPVKYDVGDEKQLDAPNQNITETVILNDLSNLEVPVSDKYVLAVETELNSQADEIMEITETKVDISLDIHQMVKDDVDTPSLPSDNVENKTNENNCMEVCTSQLTNVLKEDMSEVHYDAKNIIPNNSEDPLAEMESYPINVTNQDDTQHEIILSALVDNVIENKLSEVSDIVPIDSAVKELEKSIQTDSTVESLQANSNTSTELGVKKVRYCSSCNSIILTNYFCFECKKDTHIFCMKRVCKRIDMPIGPFISHTYCDKCMQSKSTK